MTTTAERDTARTGPPRAWVGWGLAAAGALLLGGYLLFCHGCHGDDVDDELFAPAPGPVFTFRARAILPEMPRGRET